MTRQCVQTRKSYKTLPLHIIFFLSFFLKLERIGDNYQILMRFFTVDA